MPSYVNSSNLKNLTQKKSDVKSISTVNNTSLHQQMAFTNAKKVNNEIEKNSLEISKYDDYQRSIENIERRRAEIETNHQIIEEEVIYAEEDLGEAYNDLFDAQTIVDNNPDDKNALTNLKNAEANYTAAYGSYADSVQKQAISKAAVDDIRKRENELKQNPVQEPKVTSDDIERAKNQVSNTRSSTNRFNMSQSATSDGNRPVVSSLISFGNKEEKKQNPNDLFDLRNINGKNFRGIGNAQLVTKDSYTLSPSRSYYLSDYKFADSLTLVDDLISNPKVQTIILNEFQPYDMLSPADVLINLGSFVGKAAGMIGKPFLKLGSYFLTKHLVNYYSKNTKDLYGTSDDQIRTRKYFTSDPIQVVQNMFNGGRWLNTYELPYFGRRLFKSKL